MKNVKRTFEEDDLFNRKSYATFLKQLILDCEYYQREDDTQAYAIAIDSPWGTGKSIFLEKFESMLEKETRDKIYVVHYNAWQSDFWRDAFEPLAETIWKSRWFSEIYNSNTKQQVANNMLQAMKNICLAIAQKKIGSLEYIEKAIGNVHDAIKKEASQTPDAVGSEYENYKKNVDQLQCAMGKALKGESSNKKLVVVIDELDRCRPVFAIETLEIVKHIMDVPNVVYVFSLDVKQLGAAIKQIYGSETDATGYLMRFFNYYSRMPEADVGKLVEKMIDSVKGELQGIEKIIEDMKLIAKMCGLSARDTETVGKVYQIMAKTFLREYKAIRAYRLYWFLLCAKYKKPILFSQVMSGVVSDEDRSGKTYLGYELHNGELQRVMRKIVGNKPIENNYWQVCSEEENMGTSGYKIFAAKKEKDGFVSINIGQENIIRSSWRNVRPTDTISGLLFVPDLLHWDAIRKLTPGQFFLRQMEMFEFVPNIE